MIVFLIVRNVIQNIRIEIYSTESLLYVRSPVYTYYSYSTLKIVFSKPGFNSVHLQFSPKMPQFYPKDDPVKNSKVGIHQKVKIS